MFGSARQIDGTDGWRWRLKQVKDILFGTKNDYNIDYPIMTSYVNGGGVSHRDLVDRLELHNPVDDGLSPYPFTKPMHRVSLKGKSIPSIKRRMGSRSSGKRRTIDPSPSREHRSQSKKYRSNDRSPPKGYRSPTRGYFSDDHSTTYRSDNTSPTRVNQSERQRRPTYRLKNSSPTRGYCSEDQQSPTKEYSSIAHFPSISHHPPRWDDRLDNSLSRYPRKEKDGKSRASLHFIAPPPSYPAHSEHDATSIAALR